jgi:hypothetical protein
MAEHEGGGRSPDYPTITLKQALSRLEQLIAAWGEDDGPKIARDAAGAWRFASIKGKTMSYLSALDQYGLIKDSGIGKAREIYLNDFGRMLSPGGGGTPDMRKVAALNPPVFSELWTHYKMASSTSPQAIENLLIVKRKALDQTAFTQIGVKEVTRIYLANVEFAGLFDSDDIHRLRHEADEILKMRRAAGTRGGAGKRRDQGGGNPTEQYPSISRVTQWPLTSGREAIFGLPDNVSNDEIEDVIGYIKLTLAMLEKKLQRN